MLKVIALVALTALAGCSGEGCYECALAVMSGGLQNYGAARTAASYQPAYHSTFCYPAGRAVVCN
jgi:hypothetical protein